MKKFKVKIRIFQDYVIVIDANSKAEAQINGLAEFLKEEAVMSIREGILKCEAEVIKKIDPRD